MYVAVRILGGLLALAGVVSFMLAPVVGDTVFQRLWAVEPLTAIGAGLVIVGLGAAALSYVVPQVVARRLGEAGGARGDLGRWGEVTQHYFELFDHDLGRPLRRILGKERELRAVLRSSATAIDPQVKELLDEIEAQTPSFRLMMSNIRVLVELEVPDAPVRLQPVEPREVVRKIVDRYTPVAAESEKEITWWAEPPEFGIVHSDSSAIEHIVANLVDNAVRFAKGQIEVRVTKNPTHFFARVWDDGPGIAPHYLQHIFDRGWTPEVARGDEKPSSGLGLFIARTLAMRYGGELTVESVTETDQSPYTAFLLGLPLGQPTMAPVRR